MKEASVVVRPIAETGVSEARVGIKDLRFHHSSTLSWWRKWEGWQNSSGTRTETDPAKPLASAITAQDDFITVLEKGPVFAVGEADRLTAFSGQLEQTPAIFGQRPRSGPARNQITRSNIAAV